MNIHEYQSKQIFKEYGLPVPNFLTANTTEEVLASAKEISDTNWVVKAQVHAGGRGKAGGVKVTDNLKEVEEFADKLVFLQNNGIRITINMVMVPERFWILADHVLYFKERGLHTTLKPQSNSTATKVVEGYTKDQLDIIQKVFDELYKKNYKPT